MKFYENIPKSNGVTERTNFMNILEMLHEILAKRKRGDNSKMQNTSSLPVLHNSEVSWNYSKGNWSYRVDSKLQLTQSRGNSSISTKVRISILVRDTSIIPVP